MASKNIHPKTQKEASSTPWAILVFFGLLAVFFAESFLYGTLVPFFQMRTYLEYLTHGQLHKIVKTEFIFSPYSYAQRVIRYEFLKYMESQNLDAQSLPLLDFSIEAMEGLVAIEGSDPYQHIRIARAIEKKAGILKDPSYFPKAEEYYKKAIALAPQRQEAYYAYGLSLVRQNRAVEAVAVLATTTPPVLDRDIPISYYYLGLAQFNLGEATYPEAITNMEVFFERAADNPDSNISRAIYQRFFYYFYTQQDKIHLIVAADRLTRLDTDRRELYQKVVAVLKQNHPWPRLDFQGGTLSALL